MCGRIQVLLGKEHSNALCIVVLQLPNPSFINHLTRKSCQEGPGDWDSAVVVERGESAVVAQWGKSVVVAKQGESAIVNELVRTAVFVELGESVAVDKQGENSEHPTPK